MYNGYTPQRVTKEQLFDIVDMWCNDRYATQRGLFFAFDDKSCMWTAVDNSTGDCWTEDFGDITDVIKWLNGEVVGADELPSNAWRMYHDKQQ